MIVRDDDDRRTFLNTFSEAARDYHVRVYACCLMGTHYHTLLDTPRSNLSEFIRTLNSSESVQSPASACGPQFEQRFASLIVQRAKYLRRVARYIALNPVKARLCPTRRTGPGARIARRPVWRAVVAAAGWLRWAFRADRLRGAAPV
jgi:REP element-mobilizing transposase RayT